MTSKHCSICRRRKLVLLKSGTHVIQACSVCDGDAVQIVQDREQRGQSL